jgi:hypothetical protein
MQNQQEYGDGCVSLGCSADLLFGIRLTLGGFRVRMPPSFRLHCFARSDDAPDVQVSVVDVPGASKGITGTLANREPLLPSRFAKLPLGSVRPKGWIAHMYQAA